MASRPDVWPVARLSSPDIAPAIVWATRSVRTATEAAIPYPHREPLGSLPPGTRTLVAVGGGTLLDAAKVFRRERAPGVFLVAVPSIWGSGAEASPVAVTNEGGRKVVRMGPEYLPDARVTWPALADTLPERLARRACGDAWVHALEGFLSPLASEDLRREIAGLMGVMLDLPLSNDPRWFEASAAACAAQARSSVGLVHGIAHTLEGPLRAAEPGFGWGHALLCATFLAPVLALDEEVSGRTRETLSRYGVDQARVHEVGRALFESDAYDRALPALEAHWSAVLRDPATRTNSALVRAGHLAHFGKRAFA